MSDSAWLVHFISCSNMLLSSYLWVWSAPGGMTRSKESIELVASFQLRLKNQNTANSRKPSFFSPTRCMIQSHPRSSLVSSDCANHSSFLQCVDYILPIHLLIIVTTPHSASHHVLQPRKYVISLASLPHLSIIDAFHSHSSHKPRARSRDCVVSSISCAVVVHS
jgi:hypothetical protein